MVVVETWKQPIGVIVTKSLEVGITTKGVETVVAPIMGVVKRGILIGSIAKLGNGLGGVLARRKLNGNLALPTTTIGVVRRHVYLFDNDYSCE
jgi:hypothetical protein